MKVIQIRSGGQNTFLRFSKPTFQSFSQIYNFILINRRGLAETCPYPPMKNLISLGGPHQGVYQYPRCNQHIGEVKCNLLKLKINLLAYHR
jgi:hypothetical protein